METLADRLETLECKRDDKARRVSNVAPTIRANVTADQLENGLSLEALQALNVPVLCYSTQVTVHGCVPDFNPDARPGGYKAVFRNQNGSVGVRYSAIDAEKKAKLLRCAKLSASGWHCYASSTGFDIQRSFYVRDESERAGQRAACLAALKSFPVSRYFGSVGAFSLAYGVGYVVSANLGAIPAAEFWPFVAEVFGINSPEHFAELDAAKTAEDERKNAEYRAECEERAAKREGEQKAKAERFRAFLLTVTGERLARVPRESGATFLRYGSTFGEYEYRDPNAPEFSAFTVTLKKRGACLCYTQTNPARHDAGKWKVCDARRFESWEKMAALGAIFALTLPPAVKPAPALTVQPAANAVSAAIPAGKDANAPASKAQTFALYCATGKDFRGVSLTYGQAHAALSSVQHLRGNKPAAREIVENLLGVTVGA